MLESALRPVVAFQREHGHCNVPGVHIGFGLVG